MGTINTPDFIYLYIDGDKTMVECSELQPHIIANLIYALLIKIPESQTPMEIALKRYKSEHEI